MSMAPKRQMETADPQAVKRWLERGEAVLIDVREPDETAAERIPEAMLHPLSRFDPGAISVPPGKKAIFQCGTGRRSAVAAQRYLDSGGRAPAVNLAGGLQAWKQAGLPTKRE